MQQTSNTLDQFTRARIRKLAARYRTTFAQAMKLDSSLLPEKYPVAARLATTDQSEIGDAAEALRKLSDRLSFERSRGAKPGEVQELHRRVWKIRKLMHCSLGEAVDIFFNDPGSVYELKRETSTRPCRHPVCVKPVALTSYYYCEHHQPTLEPDEGDLIYASLDAGGEV